MTDTTTVEAGATPDAQGKNADAAAKDTGTGTDSQPNNPVEHTKTFTQGEVDRIVADRLKREVKKELRKLSDEGEQKPDVSEIQQRADKAEQELRTYRAKDHFEDFIADKRNNLPTVNPAGVWRMIRGDLTFDDKGQVENLRDVLQTAKQIAPQLFLPASGSADAGLRGKPPNSGVDMNRFIRNATGRQ